MTEPPTGREPQPEPIGDDSLEERIWRRYERAIRRRLFDVSESAERRRGNSKLIDSAFMIWERNRLLPASLLVGALASRIVIYLVPLFALVIFSFGLYDFGSESAGEAARSAGMPGLFAEAAQDSTSMDEGLRIAAIVATAWATLYAANSLGRLVRRSTALVWGVSYTKLERAWLLPFTVVGLTLLAWGFTSLSVTVEEWNFDLWVGAAIFGAIVLTCFWLVVSRRLPHSPDAKRWGDLVPGAIFMGLGVVGLRLALVIYFAPAVDSLSERYGSIGLGLVMLTWAYWLGMIVVGSAEINAALFASRRARAAATDRGTQF